eukprot:1152154-Pelagomonas_calceolata.AAC.2
MRISPPASPTTRGAVRRMQEEESRLSPWAAAWHHHDGWCHCGLWVERAKECGLDNFLVISPSGAGAPHAGHPRHQGPPFCAIFGQPKPAPSFLCSLTHPKNCFQHTSLQQLLSATGRRGHGHTALRNQLSRETAAESWCTPRPICLPAGIVRAAT